MPLTRSVLLDKKVRHDLVCDANGTIDVNADPKAERMIELVKTQHHLL